MFVRWLRVLVHLSALIYQLILSFTMRPALKTCYHPHFVIAFYLNCLPEEWRSQIPRSTRHDWIHKNQYEMFGFEWSVQNQQLLKTLQGVACSCRLLQVNRALLRLIALKRFMVSNAGRIKANAFQIIDVLLNTIEKMKPALGLTMILKGIDISYSGYIRLRNKVACQYSMLPLCRTRHPAQLLQKEIEVIKKYCSDSQFQYWPLSSVFHQMIRDKAAFFSLHTFYKYTSLLNIRRSTASPRRKNHSTGIRAKGPLQILHADSTIFRTADGQKNFIHLMQDNHSRAILGFNVSKQCSAQNMFEVLSEVAEKYLTPSEQQSCVLLTDDGSENAGEVTSFIVRSRNPAIRHLIAQRDISFSNSMIEAANKQIKYRFLYHKQIVDYFALLKYIVEAIIDYNNRPHHALKGLTPLEVLDGIRFDRLAYRNQIATAKSSRIAENKRTRCCRAGF